MTIDERIKYAEQKRDEAFSNGSLQSLCYWDGYIAALKAVSDESGYRKASELAEEIFAEIGKILYKYDKIAERDKSEYGELIVMDIGCVIAELKKKYAEDTE